MSDTQYKDLIPLCQNLIKAKSYSGGEGDAAKVLTDFFKEKGFDEVIVDEFGSVVGIVNGEKPGPTILFDGHIDTVPVGNESDWSHPPFGAVIEDGKMYGRGTSDMKCAVGAMAVAVAEYTAAHGRNFAGRLAVAGVVHEECFEGVACRSISAKVKPDYVVIGEATALTLKIGQRGRAEIKLETFGKPAHSANPQFGLNAVYKICGLIEKIRHLAPTHHPVLGDGILELTDIKSSPYPGASVVPEYCAATYDRRLLVGETPESVLEPLQKLVDDAMKADPELKAKVSYSADTQPCYTGGTIEAERFFPGWLFEETDDFVVKVKNRLDAIGINPVINQYSFCTNGSHYAGEAGIKTIGFGPSQENLAHTIDEYIELDGLQKAALGYTGIIEALLP